MPNPSIPGEKQVHESYMIHARLPPNRALSYTSNRARKLARRSVYLLLKNSDYLTVEAEGKQSPGHQ